MTESNEPRVTQADEAFAMKMTQNIRGWGSNVFRSPDADTIALVAEYRTATEAASAAEMETRFWSIVDPNGVPSDMWDALDRMACAYRTRAASAATVAELLLALEMTTDLLERASRTMTEECKVALQGRRWGDTRIKHFRALLAKHQQGEG